MAQYEFVQINDRVSGNKSPVDGVILHGTVQSGLSDGQ
jgi:hypothetical protein